MFCEQTPAKNREVIIEDQKLGEELKQRDEENFEDRDNSRKRGLPTKSQRKNVQVPSSCRVNTIDIIVTVVCLPTRTFSFNFAYRSSSSSNTFIY